MNHAQICYQQRLWLENKTAEMYEYEYELGR